MRSIISALAALLLFAPAPVAQNRAAETEDASGNRAPAPALLTYSGLLTNADGAPLPDGTHTLVFRGYASEAGAGEAMWEESHDATVTAGQFWVLLGVRSPLVSEAKWYTVSVDGAPESAAVQLTGDAASAGVAPGNTLDQSYENGSFINIDQGRPIVLRGAPGAFYTGLQIQNITATFSNDELVRFRLRSVNGGASWEYRVYGAQSTGPTSPPPGTFSISNASTPGAIDPFVILPSATQDLLRLDSQTVRIGSAATEAEIAVYTTENPGAPASTVPTFTVGDYLDSGARSAWFTETGSAHTRIEPDATGDGGFFTVVRGSGGFALTVDGDVGGGSQTRVGSGASSSFFDDTVTGDASVALPASSVSSLEVFNEAGTANAFNSGPVGLSGGLQTTLARTLAAPGPGYVIALGSGELSVSHAAGVTDTFQMSVSRDCATPTAPSSQQANWQVPSALPTATYRNILTAHGLFAVAAGATQFCSVVSAPSGTTIDDQQLTLLFVPTAYGATQTNLDGGGDEPDRVASAALTRADLARERAASEAANGVRIQNELREIQQRVAELQAQMGNNQ